MDFSENISITPKHEPQDAHFCSNQTTLHDTIVYPADDPSNVTFAYHLSDDKKKDSVFVSNVILDLLRQFPEGKDYSVLRFKSDNCPGQYCCRYVLPFYSDLAKKLGKPILIYYGVNGHGRGMVDGMSSFGVKAPLRRAIVTTDFFYNKAEQLVSFLKSMCVNESNYYFKLLDTTCFFDERQNRAELTIPGCRKTRMLSFLPSGEHQMKRHMCNCESCLYGDFKNCKINEIEIVENHDNDEHEDNTFSNIYEFITGSFVALYSAPKSLENFLVYKVHSKGIAGDLVDFYGHVVKSGDEYVKGVYLEKLREEMTRVFYKCLKKEVYFYPGEIFCPAVVMNEKDLLISMEDYLFLCGSILRFK